MMNYRTNTNIPTYLTGSVPKELYDSYTKVLPVTLPYYNTYLPAKPNDSREEVIRKVININETKNDMIISGNLSPFTYPVDQTTGVRISDNWGDTFDELNKFIHAVGILPISTSKYPHVTKLWYWMNQQNLFYENGTMLTNQQVLWKKHIEFNSYFYDTKNHTCKPMVPPSITDVNWFTGIRDVMEYVRKNRKAPDPHSDINYVKNLGIWIKKHMFDHYVKTYMYYGFTEIYIAWCEFIRSDMYIQYFRYNPIYYNTTPDDER